MDARIAVFDDGKLAVEHVALADRSPGEIDVAITSAAICGSDLHTVLGSRTTPARTALGHEGVGRVVDVDDGVTDLRGAALSRGDRVVFALFRACGACDRCAGGLAMKCRSLLKYGHESVLTPPYATGTLASAVRLIPGVAVLRVPEDVADTSVVSAGCAVATAAAIVAAADQPADTAGVLVFGAGAVGAFTAAMLVSLGCPVFVSEPSGTRRALVEEFGARRLEDDRATFPVVIEASGSPAAFAEAIGRADIGGRVVAAGSVSPGNTTTTFDPAVLVTRRLTVRGVHNYTAAEFRAGVDWLLAHGHRLALDRMFSPPRPLSAIVDAFEEMRAGEHLRVLVRPEAGGAWAAPEGDAAAG